MSAQDRIEALKEKHASLERALDEEIHRPLPNQDTVHDLKRQATPWANPLTGPRGCRSSIESQFLTHAGTPRSYCEHLRAPLAILPY